jgi:hypothetical protein
MACTRNKIKRIKLERSNFKPQLSLITTLYGWLFSAIIL